LLLLNSQKKLNLYNNTQYLLKLNSLKYSTYIVVAMANSYDNIVADSYPNTFYGIKTNEISTQTQLTNTKQDTQYNSLINELQIASYLHMSLSSTAPLSVDFTREFLKGKGKI